MFTPRARDRIAQSVEYHERMARYLGGDDYVERFYERRRQEREARSAQPPTETAGDQEPSAAQDEPGDVQQGAVPAQDQRSPEQVAADNHADAAQQLRDLLASQPPEPAINVARREYAAAGLMSRLGIGRRHNA